MTPDLRAAVRLVILHPIPDHLFQFWLGPLLRELLERAKPEGLTVMQKLVRIADDVAVQTGRRAAGAHFEGGRLVAFWEREIRDGVCGRLLPANWRDRAPEPEGEGEPSPEFEELWAIATDDDRALIKPFMAVLDAREEEGTIPTDDPARPLVGGLPDKRFKRSDALAAAAEYRWPQADEETALNRAYQMIHRLKQRWTEHQKNPETPNGGSGE